MNIVQLNTVNLGGDIVVKKCEGATINNQDKVVDITENGIIEVVADSGFTGLGKVTINVNIIDRTKAPDGVSIQHIDGKFYTIDDWVANGFLNDDANGVAVVSNEAKFVISKVELFYKNWASDTATLISGILSTGDYDTAGTDYAGVENTKLILNVDTAGAAYSCANFTFPNGEKGYLPALGEWRIAYNNIEAIQSAMETIGGRKLIINSSYYWSSTQTSSESDAWGISLYKGYITPLPKESMSLARAFTTLI